MPPLAVHCLWLTLAAAPLTAQAPPLEGIAQVEHGSLDLVKTRAFYTGLLGLQEQQPGLFLLAGQTVQITAPGPPAIAFHTQDPQALRRYLNARGLTAEPLRDPEGVLIRFVPASQPPASGAAPRLHHIALAIPRARLGEALHFYRDQLGLPEHSRVEPKPGDLRAIRLRIPGPHAHLLELAVAESAGLQRIALAVADVHETHHRLRTRGYRGPERPRINADHHWSVQLPGAPRIEFLSAAIVPAATLHEEKFHGRDAWVLANGIIRAAFLRGGGHIAEARFLEGGDLLTLNPFRVPHYPTKEPFLYNPATDDALYGAASHKWLASGYMGHLLCFPHYGPSSPEEFAAGLGNHGEAPVVEWKKITSLANAAGITLIYGADLPKTLYRVSRRVFLPRGLPQIHVEETIENLADFDRPFQWMQHATFGPPFTEPGKTMLDVSATRGSGGGRALQPDQEFTWPTALARDGEPVDLRPMLTEPASGTYYALRLDPARDQQFFTLHHTGHRLLIGYLMPAATNPWLADWQENRGNTFAPWNGQAIARGIEFGNSPHAEGLRNAITRGQLFDTPAYGIIGARQRLRNDYVIFLRAIEPGFPGVRDARIEEGVVRIQPR
ncbi:MAG: hypothetical protein FJW40_18850 [Acidobacteria bacterium]|nr:hypothetical protein [Acidobacteriota bacterium]